MIVYMDETLVHQLHGSDYSYFFMDEAGVLQDGMGRTSGKGLRVIVVHAITKDGPLDSRDAGYFPIAKGWFKTKAGSRGHGDRGNRRDALAGQSCHGGLPRYHDRQHVHVVARVTPNTSFQSRFWGQENDPCPRQRFLPPWVCEVGVPETTPRCITRSCCASVGRVK